MKALLTIIIVCLTLSFSCLSQSSVNERYVLKKGIYRSYKEFLSNSPSDSLLYPFYWKDLSLKGILGDSTFGEYRMNIEGNRVKDVGFIYGFCDGENVFIYPNGYTGKWFHNSFVKIKKYGYLVYYKSFSSGTAVSIGGANGSTPPTMYDVLFNTKTKQKSVLSKRYVRELLRDNSELLAEFNKEKQKKSRLVEYTLKYLEGKFPKEVVRAYNRRF